MDSPPWKKWLFSPTKCFQPFQMARDADSHSGQTTETILQDYSIPLHCRSQKERRGGGRTNTLKPIRDLRRTASSQRLNVYEGKKKEHKLAQREIMPACFCFSFVCFDLANNRMSCHVFMQVMYIIHFIITDQRFFFLVLPPTFVQLWSLFRQPFLHESGSLLSIS